MTTIRILTIIELSPDDAGDSEVVREFADSLKRSIDLHVAEELLAWQRAPQFVGVRSRTIDFEREAAPFWRDVLS